MVTMIPEQGHLEIILGGELYQWITKEAASGGTASF